MWQQLLGFHTSRQKEAEWKQHRHTDWTDSSGYDFCKDHPSSTTSCGALMSGHRKSDIITDKLTEPSTTDGFVSEWVTIRGCRGSVWITGGELSWLNALSPTGSGPIADSLMCHSRRSPGVTNDIKKLVLFYLSDPRQGGQIRLNTRTLKQRELHESQLLWSISSDVTLRVGGQILISLPIDQQQQKMMGRRPYFKHKDYLIPC